MIVIPKEEAYESVRNRVWYPPACDNKEEHIKFLFKGCQEMDIVYCKDCKNNYNTCTNHGINQPMCDFTDRMLKETDFCSRGERSEE